MDIKKICVDWSTDSAAIRKPKLIEACEVIAELCAEIKKIESEVKYQKSRQDIKEQHYKTMIIEIQNTVSKYK